MALDGSDTDELIWRLREVRTLAKNVSQSPLSRQDAEVVYRERWIPGIGYCLPVTQFDDKQCEKLMTPFYAAMLPKMGLNRHIPKAIRYGPPKYNGKGLVHLGVHQHEKHLEVFVKALRTLSHFGHVLRTQMDKHQMVIGCQAHFLSLSSEEYSYGEASRIQFLWDQNTKRGITLHLQDAWRQVPRRENDVALMDVICKKVREPEKLRRINDVRLWLRVTFLSDISNLDGNALEKWALYGPPSTDDTLEWPSRRAPLAENMKLWRQSLYETVTAMNGLYPANLGNLIQNQSVPVAEYHGEDDWEKVNAVLASLDEWERSLVGDFSVTKALVYDFTQWVQRGTIYAGSDGSVTEKLGAHGFAITSGVERTAIWGGSAPTAGNKFEMSSLRAEHAGALAIFFVLHALQVVLKMDFSVELWIDNAEVLQRMNQDTVLDFMALDYDMWMASRVWEKRVSFQVEWRKVDSHRERKLKEDPTKVINGNPLAWRLNEAVDQLVGEECVSMRKPGKEVFIPHSTIMVKLNGSMIYGSLYDRITESVHGPVLEEYMCTKYGWTREVLQSIDWDAMETFMNRQSGTRATNIIKLAHDWQNDNHQNSLFYKDKSSMCPACNLAEETHMHFLSCSDPILRRVNQRAWDGLKTVMKKWRTSHFVYRAINAIITAVVCDEDPVRPVLPGTPLGVVVTRAWAEQQSIGWVHLCKGRMSKQWGIAQGLFYGEHPDLKSKQH